jgi:3-oxoadipate CoA-transferase alpha subunit
MVLEQPIRADVALVKAQRADAVGNLTYRKTARNFGPVMATAATRTVVQVSELVATGDLDPEAVVTPAIYVDAVVRLDSETTLAGTKPQAPAKGAVA